jgi:hypothetical protein
MLWDPLNAWPQARCWLWAALAVWVCSFEGPRFVRSLRPPVEKGVDFFQDWASARNYLSGSPIYLDLKQAVERYLGFKISEKGEPGVRVSLEVNAHPPTSVLLVLPLSIFSYPDAVLVWNLMSIAALIASLWIVQRQLAIPFSAWASFPIVALLLVCWPFRQQVNEGQLSLFLLLLLTSIWASNRSERPGWAGVLLGLATAIKLFPGFLFCYFILQRQWKAVRMGIISFAVLTGLTVSVLGLKTYQSYYKDVIPRLENFRSCWGNASLQGLWIKLFDPGIDRFGFMSEHTVESAWRSPALARLGIWLSSGVLVAVLARIVGRANSRQERDQAFGLTVIAMLLVSPITWEHSLLLLLIPFAELWVRLPPSNPARVLVLFILTAVWMEPYRLYDAIIPKGNLHGVAHPLFTLSVLSIQCYALFGLFALTAALNRPDLASARLPNKEIQPLRTQMMPNDI